MTINQKFFFFALTMFAGTAIGTTAAQTITQTLPTTIAASNNSMLIIGHRGACGYEPENTLVSFQRALDMGVAMIELDVFVCASGELVVIHDDEVDRTTNGHGNVVDKTFQELRSLIVEGKEQIPTLQEVVELINRRIPINIELKGPGTAKPVAEMIKSYLAEGWSCNDFIVSSFDHDQVLECKQLCPDIKAGVLFEENRSVDLTPIALAHQASFIGIDCESVTAAMVAQSHQAGLPVFAYTVNNKELADELRAMHVDGIFTNYSDKV